MKVKIGKFPRGAGNQRISVEIERHDTYGCDHTLAYIIYPMLLQLKETKHGIPGNFAAVGGENYESQGSFDFYSETVDEMFDERVKQWDDVMDKMIWSFEQIIRDDYDEQYHHGESKYRFVDTEPMLNPITGKTEVMHQMVDTNPEEHWYDYVGHQLHEERIQEGLELFGKYFRNLWD